MTKDFFYSVIKLVIIFGGTLSCSSVFAVSVFNQPKEEKTWINFLESRFSSLPKQHQIRKNIDRYRSLLEDEQSQKEILAHAEKKTVEFKPRNT